MIVDGHAHTYPDQVADRVLTTFTTFHHMEPTASIGTGTVDDLTTRMRDAGISYVDTKSRQLAYHGKAVRSIPRKPADRFRQDQVCLSRRFDTIKR